MANEYLNLAEFKVRSIMPNEQIDRIEELKPGWLQAEIESTSRDFDAYLGKRYRVPLGAPSPTIKKLVASVVTYRAHLVHGVPATDKQLELIAQDAQEAWARVKEAANGETGLLDLAPSDRLPGQGVTFGSTRVYSETSPYVHYDRQRESGRAEDRSRRGTGGGGS